jgi:hypothetical protein
MKIILNITKSKSANYDIIDLPLSHRWVQKERINCPIDYLNQDNLKLIRWIQEE